MNSRLRLLQDLISSLENRMADTSEGVVHATSVMDLALWPILSFGPAFVLYF